MKYRLIKTQVKSYPLAFKAILLLPLLFVFITSAQDEVNFIVSEPGSAPYIYTDNGTYVGIIPEMLQGLIDSGSLKIKYLSNSRSRSEEYLYNGKADMMFLSESWLKNPDKVITSISILEHRTFLYKTEKFDQNFALTSLKDNKSICTIKSYKYPALEIYFAKKILKRIDSSNHKTMFRMLVKGRCDLVISNELNAKTLFNSQEFKRKTFFRSNVPTSVVPTNIILRASLIPLQKLINMHIKKLKDSGELEKIINNNVYTDL